MNDPAAARLVGARASLRLPEPSDYVELRRLELGSDLAIRWRHAGLHVSLEEYGAGLVDNSLVCFVYDSLVAPISMGLLVAYGADFRNGFAYIGLARLKSSGSSIPDARVAAEAFALFVDYVFQAFSFRKLCIEVAEFNLGQFASLTALLEQEARYRDHVFLGGRWWDLLAFSLWRESWPEVRSRLSRPPS